MLLRIPFRKASFCRCCCDKRVLWLLSMSLFFFPPPRVPCAIQKICNGIKRRKRRKPRLSPSLFARKESRFSVSVFSLALSFTLSTLYMAIGNQNPYQHPITITSSTAMAWVGRGMNGYQWSYLRISPYAVAGSSNFRHKRTREERERKNCSPMVAVATGEENHGNGELTW